jgi:hypothetical protein
MGALVSSAGTRAGAVLDAWRERGADQLDPVRFHFIEALDRRAAGYSGEARRILDEKLSKLLEAYANDLERAACNAGDAGNAVSLREPSRGALAELIDHIGIARCVPPNGNGRVMGGASSRSAFPPESEMLDYFRETWFKVRTEKQLRQSLDQVPGNAGPLNSSRLVHRSLSLMRELSPDYLQQFMSYLDALSWMEQIADSSALARKDAPRGDTTRKGARSRRR